MYIIIMYMMCYDCMHRYVENLHKHLVCATPLQVKFAANPCSLQLACWLPYAVTTNLGQSAVEMSGITGQIHYDGTWMSTS